jgi:hypothetical protein
MFGRLIHLEADELHVWELQAREIWRVVNLADSAREIAR